MMDGEMYRLVTLGDLLLDCSMYISAFQMSSVPIL